MAAILEKYIGYNRYISAAILPNLTRSVYVMMCFHARVYLLIWNRVDFAHHIVDQISENSYAGGVNKRFQAKVQSIQTFVLSKFLQRSKQFCKMIKTSKYSLWVVWSQYVPLKPNMATAVIFKK